MRLIIKPAGIIILLVSFAALAFLAIRGGNKGGNPSPAQASPAAKTGSQATPADAAAYAPPSSLPPVDWSKARRILEPDIASNQWRMLLAPGGAAADHTVVKASVSGHPFARRITTQKVGANPWEVQIAHPLNAAFKKGMRFRLTYWGRSPESTEIAAVVEQHDAPYTKLAFRKAQLTPEWKQYSEEWEQTEDTPSGWAHIDFQVGAKAGSVEFTGIMLDAVESKRP